MDVARYARQIALPEVGPDGQARICAARVAVVGRDRAAETAALYLRAAGVGRVLEPTVAQGFMSRRTLEDEEIDLVIRSGFDDMSMDAVAAQLGLPVIYVRATAAEVDLISFSGRVPSADAPLDVPFKAAQPSADDASAVLAGALAAVEALHMLIREAAGPVSPRITHVRLPLDGREPLVQAIGRPA